MMAGDRIDLGFRFGAGSWPGRQSELIIPSSYVVVAARSLVGPTREPSLETVTDLPWLQELGTREMEEWAERRDLGGRGPATRTLAGWIKSLAATEAGLDS